MKTTNAMVRGAGCGAGRGTGRATTGAAAGAALRSALRALLGAVLALGILVAAGAEEGGAGHAKVGAKALIADPRAYDGREILFEGEAIGDSMRRGDNAWVNVLDADAALGVYAPLADLDAIGVFGSSRARGDLVLVRGTFHRACPDHGGDMDIHASSITVVRPGHATPHPVDALELVLLPISIALAAGLYIVWRKREAAVRKGGWLS